MSQLSNFMMTYSCTCLGSSLTLIRPEICVLVFRTTINSCRIFQQQISTGGRCLINTPTVLLKHPLKTLSGAHTWKYPRCLKFVIPREVAPGNFKRISLYQLKMLSHINRSRYKIVTIKDWFWRTSLTSYFYRKRRNLKEFQSILRLMMSLTARS